MQTEIRKEIIKNSKVQSKKYQLSEIIFEVNKQRMKFKSKYNEVS